MKNAITLKLCVKTILALTIVFMVGQTVCYAEEQAPAAVEANSIENDIIDKDAAMWSIPEDERTDENFGPGILLNQNASPSEATQIKKETSAVETEVQQVIPKEEQKLVAKTKQTVTVPSTPAEEKPVVEAPKQNLSNRWGISLTEKEKNVLARIVKLECGGESNLGQQAVIEVIFNRVSDSSFPNTVISVLNARGQFTTWKNVNSKAATPTAKEYANIDTVLNGNTHIFPSITVYFSRGAQNPRIQARIGNHTFCNK